MKISSKDFKKISIRGRAAYAICCFENALIHYGIKGEGWNILLEKMWEFTSLSGALNEEKGELYLEKWQYMIDYSPRMSYFYGNKSYKDCYDWLVSQLQLPPTEHDYNILRSNYNQNRNETVILLCKEVYDVGASEIFGGIDNLSQYTLDKLQSVINILEKESIPLPSMEPFKQYVFTKPEWDYDLHGWGETFDGKQYSKFLKS